MDPNEEVLFELRKINQKIDDFTNPWKAIWHKFLDGTFYALGAIFGTFVIASAVIYLFSKFNYTAMFSNWISSTLSQVNWTKIITPQLEQIQTKPTNINY